MNKKKNVKFSKNVEEMEIGDGDVAEKNEEEIMQEGTSDDEEDEDMEDEEELLTDNVANVGTENFDFEAFPLNDTDINGIINLLTQIFLRTDVDCQGLAKSLIEMSPIGSVFKPAEDALDDDEDAVAYGVISMVELVGPSKYQTDIANLILNRARKFASNDVVQKFEAIFNSSKDKRKNYLLVNERMLHFPQEIAPPAFTSLNEDFEEAKLKDKIDNVIIISKIRIPDTALESEQSNNPKQKKKKVGKAEKKRRRAAALVNADVEFENQEEELLFKNGDLLSPTYFQYNVEGDVERESKFHTITIDDVPHRPYRRVTILNRDDFFKFMELVVQMG